MSYDRWKLDTPAYCEPNDEDDEDTDLDELDEPTNLWEDDDPNEPKFYSANDKAGWKKAGLLEFDQFAHELKYFNRSPIDEQNDEGEWYWVDEKNLTIYSGEFGRHNKPGSVYCTYAEKYPNSEDFNDILTIYEQEPEYLDEDDLDDESL